MWTRPRGARVSCPSKRKTLQTKRKPTPRNISFPRNRVLGTSTHSSRAMYQFLSSSVFHPSQPRDTISLYLYDPLHDPRLLRSPQPRPPCEPLSTPSPVSLFTPFLPRGLFKGRPEPDRAREPSSRGCMESK